MHDIFLSYAREDRQRVEQLAAALSDAGLDVWWDRKIDAGTRFDSALDKALRDSRCVVVAWSPNSIDSDWVRSEAHDGFTRGVLVPLMFEEVSPPLPFRRLQMANLCGWPKSKRSANEFNHLIDSVRRVLDAAAAGQAKTKAVAAYGGVDAKVAIAVLPLTDRAREPKDEYLADGITEDIIGRLQRFRTFPIISRQSVFAYKGMDYDLPKIAQELHVSYLIVGQIRKHGKRIRVTVELVETTDFHTVWSENYDREIVDIFDLQDEISLVIAAMLQPEIERSERRKSLPSRTESIASWHLVRQGMWHQYKLTREDAREAKRYFELALEQDPHSVEALVQMSWWHWWDLSRRRCRKDEWSEMMSFAKRASVLDPKDSRPQQLIGVAQMMSGDPASALKTFKDAIVLNPCNAAAYAAMGSAYELIGQPEEALAALDRAVELSPFDTWVFHAHGERARAFYMLEDWDNAVDAADRALNLRSGYWMAHMVKTSALARAGRHNEAGRALERLLSHRPDFSSNDIHWIGYSDFRKTGDFVEALRLAGWCPEDKGELQNVE